MVINSYGGWTNGSLTMLFPLRLANWLVVSDAPPYDMAVVDLIADTTAVTDRGAFILSLADSVAYAGGATDSHSYVVAITDFAAT